VNLAIDAHEISEPEFRRRYVELGRVGARRACGETLAEGWRLVERAIVAGTQMASVVVSDRVLQRPTKDESRVIAMVSAVGIDTHQVSPAMFSQLTQGRSYGDIIARVALPARFDSGQADLERILVGVDVLDPGNIGALWRTAHALGVDGVVWCRGTDPTHPKAVRTSMGSCFRLPYVHHVADPAEMMRILTKCGWSHVAMAIDGGTDQVQAGHRSALWVGGEAHGLPADIVAQAQFVMTIETVNSCNSLSVNAAAAIGLSHIAVPKDD